MTRITRPSRRYAMKFNLVRVVSAISFMTGSTTLTGGANSWQDIDPLIAFPAIPNGLSYAKLYGNRYFLFLREFFRFISHIFVKI